MEFDINRERCRAHRPREFAGDRVRHRDSAIERRRSVGQQDEVVQGPLSSDDHRLGKMPSARWAEVVSGLRSCSEAALSTP